MWFGVEPGALSMLYNHSPILQVILIPWHLTAWRGHGQELPGLATAKSPPGTGAKITKQKKGLRSASLKDSHKSSHCTLRCVLFNGDEPGCLELTFLTRSFSSIWPRSLPAACAMRLPATRFPTITEAGPTPVNPNKANLRTVIQVTHYRSISGLAQTGSKVHSAMTKSLHSSKRGTNMYTLWTKQGRGKDWKKIKQAPRRAGRAQAAAESKERQFYFSICRSAHSYKWLLFVPINTALERERMPCIL